MHHTRCCVCIDKHISGLPFYPMGTWWALPLKVDGGGGAGCGILHNCCWVLVVSKFPLIRDVGVLPTGTWRKLGYHASNCKTWLSHCPLPQVSQGIGTGDSYVDNIIVHALTRQDHVTSSWVIGADWRGRLDSETVKVLDQSWDFGFHWPPYLQR